MEEKKFNQPLENVVWRKREELKANDYNPNSVAPPEMQLLKISILEDGWTQPIVINPDMTIVDGFHRWLTSGTKEVSALTDGYVPTVMITPKDGAAQKASTIRHNRARGSHAVLKMSDIVVSMVQEGRTGEQIMEELKMEEEEVTRLLFRAGIPKSDVFKDKDFSKSWNPK